MASNIHYRSDRKHTGRTLCDRHYWGSVKSSTEVKLVTCRNCRRILTTKAELTWGTPMGIVSDKLKEMGFE